MAKTKKKNGGKREGAGRKPLPQGEAKQTVPMYFPKKVIDKLGADNLKQIARSAVMAEYERRLDSIL